MKSTQCSWDSVEQYTFLFSVNLNSKKLALFYATLNFQSLVLLFTSGEDLETKMVKLMSIFLKQSMQNRINYILTQQHNKSECWNVALQILQLPLICSRLCTVWSWAPWPLFKDTVMIKSLYKHWQVGRVCPDVSTNS